MTDAFGGIFGLLILALDVWAIVSVLRSDATTGKKAMWVLLIVILPVLGLIIWGIMGPRGNRPDDRNLRP
ncbi:PLD nuclease N-terminal domain-containing protein [Pseudomonas stutzeri]|uniref:PLD nuclease N-terminal domain-containing protein n=1 Tax=Pseudomonadaceae TaxID=135621 RepID=UPI00103C5A3A|nr:MULTISPECIES: PLD nuclease N-terminal domain-containing protein [Pseudomonadaceae]MBC8648420.1 PLDc_N domain-containing protein [Pseudomonas sp. MT4]MCQ4287173.1 PLD nuclease N-terminal domain-containing protein [Stutzerimonas stutzeri]MCQ4307835.1 PLD nuclease N-terminal domain-containing protein [Stutzerimonas stutzeri]QXY90365.1 PLDc_N domain-containing protein [Pseudomonas sp. MTM4]TCD24255.1 PLDc_N domain-containing protein [Pseudomonas sp. IC_126]